MEIVARQLVVVCALQDGRVVLVMVCLLLHLNLNFY